MNKQVWELYKESARGKECIALFDQEKEDIIQGSIDICNHAVKWGQDAEKEDYYFFWLLRIAINLDNRELLPDDMNRDSFIKFIKEFDILDVAIDKDGQVLLLEGDDTVLLPKDRYRDKASMMLLISLYLFYNYDFFIPILLPRRFDIFQHNCDLLNIELPDIPRTNDYSAYLAYYYDICDAVEQFRVANGMTEAEVCACIYDFAPMLGSNETKSSELPKPINVWLTGASGKSDFAFLDSLGSNTGGNSESIWACNEKTRRGDIIVLYCKSPRSYIHSIWRSNSGGIFNPFDYYHCRTTVCDGILTPHITFNDLKSDAYLSKVPIVRKGLQGINGVELTAKDYSELLRIIVEKGGEDANYPHLYVGADYDFGELLLEKDVEEKILIPLLEKLGYSESDWTRQLSQKAGRKEKAIPDFVFFPKGEKHFENAPMIIEAKFDMAPVQELQKAFKQGLSYARMLRSSIMGICDKERLILYKVDSNGSADRANPIFENHWQSIFTDDNTGAELNHIIGREVVVNL